MHSMRMSAAHLPVRLYWSSGRHFDTTKGRTCVLLIQLPPCRPTCELIVRHGHLALIQDGLTKFELGQRL